MNYTNYNNETLGMDLLEELGKATLISTTNFQFKGHKGRKGRLSRFGRDDEFYFFFFDMIKDYIRTSVVAKVEQKDQELHVHTLNSLYVFEIDSSETGLSCDEIFV